MSFEDLGGQTSLPSAMIPGSRDIMWILDEVAVDTSSQG